MLDLHYVRNNLETVRKALKSRNFPTGSLDDFIELDETRRRVIGESDEVNQQRNSASKEIGALMQSGNRDEAEAKKAEVAGLKDKQSELEQRRKEVETEMDELLAGLPNIPADGVPVGADESANVEIRKWGEPREFDFEVKDHVNLGENLGILDLERATKIAGSRFAILNGA
ncbi:MAG: serine--tRNA ligase, partial [Pyrinomonadaceae bacterium]